MNCALIQRLVERKKARVVSAAGEGSDDDGPTSVLMRTIVDAFSQYERALIQSRTRAALAVKKSRNERIGGLPYGRKLASDGRTLEPHPEEQRALTLLLEMRAAGFTMAAIAARLTELGFKTRGNGAWTKQGVHAQIARAAA